ncbi:uncharacterized protein C22orf15 homolog [Delphinapterus leucas]|uniref:Uncharacterized protein C22orf15 homolog n=1 Tax=Delphinapterus leucas TaxID=9749 RepID=A0A7F8KI39_DELLE|nr:uncharacterized protein C22orf15 homolog [Delphinapterus leucas]
MFITVMSGAGCWELVNPWCSLVILITHLRQRGQVPPDVTIALLAEDGHLVNLAEGLEEGPSLAPSMGSPLLQERGIYVLVQIITTGHPSPAEPLLWPGPSPELPIQCPVLTPLWASKQVQSERWGCGPPGQPGISLLPSAEGEGGAPTCYESLLENLDEWCPELAEELRWLSGLPPLGDGWRRRAGTLRGHQQQGPPSRPRRVGFLLSGTH